ncbi:MAG: hypothetical protein JJ975_00555 [Bacteroidia bacterium]|nr:hypothetical protein [Bacteroidia bacterium]
MFNPVDLISTAMATTGGPTPPEYSRFQKIGPGQLVDQFTGNMQYSIPLFDIGGYPINLTYSGDINSEQNAGWVGLGWSLQAGSIGRAMRGIPDDFKGDEVEKKINKKPRIIQAYDFQAHNKEGKQVELVGLNGGIKMNGLPTIIHDNYRGFGINYDLSFGLSANKTIQTLTGEVIRDSTLSDSIIAIVLRDSSITQKIPILDFKTSYSAFDGNSYEVVPRIGFLDNRWLGGKEKRYHILLSSPSIKFSTEKGLKSMALKKPRFRYGATDVANFGANFLSSSYLPQFNPDIHASVKVFGLAISGDKIFADDRAISGKVVVSTEKYSKKFKASKAYGSLYFQEGTEAEGALLDHQVASMVIDKTTQKLPPTVATYDVFNVSANGVGGSFKIKQNSIGILTPSLGKVTTFTNPKIQVEIGGGTNWEIAGKFGLRHVIKKTERWEGKNEAAPYLKFKDRSVNSTYEPFALRNDFEFVETDMAYDNQLGGKQAIKFGLKSNTRDKLSAWRITNDMVGVQGNDMGTLSAQAAKSSRGARLQAISYLTADEASKQGITAKLRSYQFESTGAACQTSYRVSTTSSGSTSLNYDEIDRASDYRKGHHISEINVLQPDGMLYNFGLPVYQVNEYNVRFAVDGSGSGQDLDDYLSKTTSYTKSGNADDSESNKKGINNFFEEVKTPSYASTFLLTTILSQDYSDLTGDGPTKDDLGNYVKFNYGMPDYNSSSSDMYHSLFNWRTPFTDANWARGYESDELDDQASFSYGQREQWYMHSIETKNEIVVFELEDRADGYGNVGRNGGINTSGNRQKCLVGIKIFDRASFEKDGLSASPTREIKLGYSYDLCQGVKTYQAPSVSSSCNEHPLKDLVAGYGSNVKFSGGKLTLHTLQFIDHSFGMATSDPYLFEYNTANPDYAYLSGDRWGTYHPLDLYKKSGVSDDRQTTLAHFPYTHQDPNNIDTWASAWMMSDVTLPSGGKITWTYESDDYAYVQNEPAMVMRPISGIRGSLSDYDDNELYDGIQDPNLYITFEKDPGTTSVDYITNDSLVFFSFNVNLARTGERLANEQVSGFFSVVEHGDIASTNKAYIKVAPYELGRLQPTKVNPVTKMALQYALSNVPHVMNPKGYTKRSNTSEKIDDAVNQAVGIIPEYIKSIMGSVNYYQARSHAQRIDIDRSFIRLLHPQRKKYGGGHRVKTVTTYDGWHHMSDSTESEASYTTLYTYNKGSDSTSTSGVAIYEPFIGGEENPLVRPIQYEALKDVYRRKRSGPLGSVSIGYDLGPIGEEFYPAAQVGYSKVTVQHVAPHQDIVRHQTGRTEYEFYTAYDFPTKSSMTTIDKRIRNFTSPQLKDTFKSKEPSTDGVAKEPAESDSKKFTFGFDVQAKLGFAAASQGFMIEQNDMHGKPKSVKTFKPNGKNAITSKTFHYKMDSKNALVNTVTVLRKDGSFEDVEMGVQMVPTVFAFRTTEINQDGAITPNVDIANPMPIPIIPSVFGSYAYHSNDSRIMIVTKQVFRNGILDSIHTMDKGNHTFIKNMAWDAVTGKVMVTKTKDEFNDNVYTLNKPAYWMNGQLAGAYENLGLTVELQWNGSSLTDPSGSLLPGDILVPDDFANTTKYWVLSSHNGTVELIDQLGNNTTPTNRLRVFRSGHKNLLTYGAETIVLKDNPLDHSTGKWHEFANWDKVISAKTIDYHDERKMLYKFRYCAEPMCTLPAVPQVSGDLTAYGYGYRNTPSSYTQDFGFHYDSLDSGAGNGIFYGKPAPCDCGRDDENPMHPLPNCALCSMWSAFHPGDIINPYVYGLKGNWRPASEVVYYEKRNAHSTRVQVQDVSTDPNSTNIRESGYLSDFKPYWTYNSSTSTWQKNSTQSLTNPWTWKDSVTKTDFLGNDLETVSALNGIRNSILYDYQRSLPVAAVSNAAYNEVLFESFEDYSGDAYVELNCQDYLGLNTVVTPDWQEEFCESFRHWRVGEALIGGVNRISEQQAHTGNKALMLGDGWTDVELDNDASDEGAPSPGTPSNVLTKSHFATNFYLKPDTDQEYIVSLWVKEGFEGQFEFHLTKDVGGTSTPVGLTTETPDVFVNEWRKMTYRFTLLAGEEIERMRFMVNRRTGEPALPCFVDDIMIFPEDAIMNAYVYDKDRKRLMASLGPNNFATFYEYNEAGRLQRNKVETDRGIMTLSENYQSFKD